MKVLSLFANIGVAEAYLRGLGIEVSVANELLERRAKLYSEIYPETEMISGDITNAKIFNHVIEAAKNRKSVYFITCQELMLQLKRAESENRLDQRLKFFTRQKLLIIDEIGYINLDKEDANLFFQLISRRYEQRSTIITTNKNLSKWSTIFGDPVIANAILDRLLHHSHIVSIVGPSYRIKDVMDSFEN